MRCEHGWTFMDFAFDHKACRVWWCRDCLELFLEEDGHQHLLNPGPITERRLADPHSEESRSSE